MQITLRGQVFDFSRTYIMGVLNVTPDSFSGDGIYKDASAAAERAVRMAANGADMIDIGGESTRPGSARITEQEEKERLISVIELSRKKSPGLVLSADTYKPAVAKAAVEAGADIINDISAGTIFPEMLETVAGLGCGYVMMHMQGTPQDMQLNPVYSSNGPASDIRDFFAQRIKSAVKAGINEDKIILDPGIGFGKTLEHNFEILDKLQLLKEFGLPVMVGTSRKSMIGAVLNAPPSKRLYGTAATVTFAITKGADIVRVHDVREIKDVVAMTDAMHRRPGKTEKVGK